MNPSGGIYRYWSELLAGLSERSVETIEVKNSKFDKLAKIERFLYFSAEAKNIDIVHSSYYRLPKFNANSRFKTVVTAYDCIHERYRTGIVLKSHVYAKKRALNYCDHVISISESTKKDLIKFYSVPESKISVCHLNVSPIFRTSERQKCSTNTKFLDTSDTPFFLFVGGRKGYKNFNLAVEALENLPEAQLKICGGGPLNSNELKFLAKKLEGRYEFIPSVNDHYLKWLYQNSIALLYPSSFEGFGLPPLECILSGGRVVSQDTSSLKEVLPKGYPGLSPFSENESYKSIVENLYYNKVPDKSWGLHQSFIKKWTEYSWIDETIKIYQGLL